MLEPVFIETQEEWRQWLMENHDKAKEFQMGFYKVKAKKKGITNAQAVDEALCFGWIDAVVNGIDEYTWTKRFTPRKAKSIWSKVNINRVEELKQMGRMHPAGLKVYESRDEKRSGLYSFENEVKEFTGDYLEAFLERKAAWDFYLTTPPSYRRAASHWVLTAKQEKTRDSRMEKLIQVSAEGRRLDHLVSKKKKN